MVFMTTWCLKNMIQTFAAYEIIKPLNYKLIKQRNYKNKWLDLDIDFSLDSLDIVCMFISCLLMYLYLTTKNWVYNNIIAIVFTIFGI